MESAFFLEDFAAFLDQLVQLLGELAHLCKGFLKSVKWLPNLAHILGLQDHQHVLKLAIPQLDGTVLGGVALNNFELLAALLPEQTRPSFDLPLLGWLGVSNHFAR